MPAGHGQVVPGAGQIARGPREHVVGDLVPVLLIEVVADAGPVHQQVLHCHVLADERQILTSTGRAVVDGGSARRR